MCQFKNTTYLLFKSIIGIKKEKEETDNSDYIQKYS